MLSLRGKTDNAVIKGGGSKVGGLFGGGRETWRQKMTVMPDMPNILSVCSTFLNIDFRWGKRGKGGLRKGFRGRSLSSCYSGRRKSLAWVGGGRALSGFLDGDWVRG